ncbi:MAG: hypothetical protein JWR33_1959 [Naasia sp.]|jgi:uncharacterized membrane protein HdeD (DUF308 family)|uniref:HdeD family acid-resistance protein n=1 Tax=Naasia sp. TaxID=2546198 RepID=UPI00261FBCD4|nr:DUF308 domain-containing protein [Naasia sp.]MCU1571218.1 hypothetical protein [Naasia sp.]
MTEPLYTPASEPTPPTGPGTAPFLARVHRSQTIAVAAIGVLLGVIGLVLPGPTLYTVAILFGSFLVATGIFRIVTAIIADGYSAPMRWVSGTLGVFVVIAGILALSDPFQALVVLAIVIGIGWIADGLVDLIAGVRNAIKPRWFGYVSGIVSIAAGVAMFVLPAAGLGPLVTIGAILLIAVSITTLLMIPRTAPRTRTTA